MKDSEVDRLADSNDSHIYTVFAGGDDFLLIGPHHIQLFFLESLKKAFDDFTCRNSKISFSASVYLTGPNINLYTLSINLEKELKKAKDNKCPKGILKNSVAVFGQAVDWPTYEKLRELEFQLSSTNWKKDNSGIVDKYSLSQGFIYKLIEFAKDAEDSNKDKSNIRASLWYSKLAYLIARLPSDTLQKIKNESINAQDGDKENLNNFHGTIMNNLKAHRLNYLIPLFNHLYKHRSTPANNE